MIYQHPLGYLLGLEGFALLRAFGGEHDREFTMAGLARIRALLDSIEELGDGTNAEAVATSLGYDDWAGFYDQPGNMLIDLEEPIVHDILDGLKPGTALDAACGTGRHAAYLARLGHDVIGVDSSPGMLDKARAKVPNGQFHESDVHRLPAADEQIDVLVCALALNHVTDLVPVFAEFDRVLKPGGHLVISDHRNLHGAFGWPLVTADPDGRHRYIPQSTHRTSDYLTAALPLGLRVLRCEEPRRPTPFVNGQGGPHGSDDPAMPFDPEAPPNIWALHAWNPEAVNAAYRDTPAAIVWQFQKAHGQKAHGQRALGQLDT
ncbi:MAG: class I SAM-dependent methyltransferase [Stackebrandtia sp.]